MSIQMMLFLSDCVEDTYTAQATVGDVMKGMTNHKVISSVNILLDVLLTQWIENRTWSPMKLLSWYLVTVTVEEDPWQRCWTTYVLYISSCICTCHAYHRDLV